MADDALIQIAIKVGKALQAKGWMLATAESCTGGWVGEVVTAVAGSSKWFDRGFITYSNASKIELLGIRNETLDSHGAVSEAIATEMADGALKRSQANITVAITGIAGPDGGSADKPVGTVCFAWATANETSCITALFEGDRQTIRQQAVLFALKGVLQRILSQTPRLL